MPSFRTDPAFLSAVTGTRSAIQQLDKLSVPDAYALEFRKSGGNNLQGHVTSIVPLAVAFIRMNHDLAASVRGFTNLANNMGPGSAEAKNANWSAIISRLHQFKTSYGSYDVALQKGGKVIDVNHVMNSYLSAIYHGGQSTGSAGDTVFKRTLKIYCHVFGV